MAVKAAATGKVVAVIQLLNKEGGVFDECVCPRWLIYTPESDCTGTSCVGRTNHCFWHSRLSLRSLSKTPTSSATSRRPAPLRRRSLGARSFSRIARVLKRQVQRPMRASLWQSSQTAIDAMFLTASKRCGEKHTGAFPQSRIDEAVRSQ
jgi:hypothetical protein